MPAWSYIPYNDLPYSCESDSAFHPAFCQAAYARIKHTLFKAFGDVSLKKLHFLHRLVEGVLKHRNSHSAYQVVLEAFGEPLFCIRNLAHTLQDPVDRMVYVIRLEDALHGWLLRKEEWCWESAVLIGFAGLLGLSLAYIFTSAVAPTTPMYNWHNPQLLHMLHSSLA